MWCPICDMLVPWVALNYRHLDKYLCAKGYESKFRRMDV